MLRKQEHRAREESRAKSMAPRSLVITELGADPAPVGPCDSLGSLAKKERERAGLWRRAWSPTFLFHGPPSFLVTHSCPRAWGGATVEVVAAGLTL